jgi:iron complex outermembrane recepter protein
MKRTFIHLHYALCIWLYLAFPCLCTEHAANIGSVESAISDDSKSKPDDPAQMSSQTNLPASYLQQQPTLRPQLEVQPQTQLPPASGTVNPRYFGDVTQGLPGFERRVSQWALSSDTISGEEGKFRATTDAGNLLGQSPDAIGVGTQRRTPVVNEPRVRGSRIGQLAASGSYWIPARMDLDTALSKLDSSLIDQITVIKGPYSVRDGPGVSFLDVDLIHSPRYADGFEIHGESEGDYKTNGQQWHARQDILGGSNDWGFRVGYGHRAGNDYVSGSDESMATKYNSGDVFCAFGYDPSPNDSTEFNYLRVDQNNVEYPGMAFDIDRLATNGYEFQYERRNTDYYDRLRVDTWHNRTQFTGDAQNPSKRVEFPYLNYIHYVGYTDVDSTSTGFRAIATWGDDDGPQWSMGIDLRYLMQRLDEIGSGRVGFIKFTDANSPIPQSQSANPGLFIERHVPVGDHLTLSAGARADVVSAEVTADPASLEHLGNQPVSMQSSFYNIVGTSDVDQQFYTWATYLRGDYKLDDHLTTVAGYGFSQRPPSLTEMYVCQSFMFVLQNGLNSLTGDPLLAPEQRHQFDLGLKWEYSRFRGGVFGFCALMHDYITFENMRIVRGPPSGNVVQENLKYVNTDLATLVGSELYSEYDCTDWLTPYATLSCVQGEDLTRNGDFATKQASPGSPSVRVYGLPRGYFSGVTGAASEPLPQLIPLESRLGVRIHDRGKSQRWEVELGPRIVAPQYRVATSLLESPTAGFAVWNIRGAWHPNKHWTYIAGVDNFLNRNYQEHLDFRSADGYVMLQPGISAYFGTDARY